MRWATPSEMIEIFKAAVALLCYASLFCGLAWLINLVATTIKEAVECRKKQRYAQAEKERLEAWRRYNERRAILSDPDYYGEI